MNRNASPEKYVTAAVEAFEAGFATKTAKTNALAALGRAFDILRERIAQMCLDSGGPERQMPKPQQELYWAMPYQLNNWRPKHAAQVAKLFNEGAQIAAQIDRLVELRAQINDAEVAPKAPTKAAREESIRLSATGKVYADEFGKLAPELEKDFEDYITGAFRRLTDKYGDAMVAKLGADYWRKKLPEDVSEGDVATFKHPVRTFLTVASLRNNGPAQIDRARLDKEAKAYAKQQIDQFVVKLTQKLGDLTDVRIRQVNAHGFECMIEGSLRGHKVLVKQSRKFVVNQHGTFFHQWPALIYVDGKFVTEAAFKRLSAGA